MSLRFYGDDNNLRAEVEKNRDAKEATGPNDGDRTEVRTTLHLMANLKAEDRTLNCLSIPMEQSHLQHLNMPRVVYVPFTYTFILS